MSTEGRYRYNYITLVYKNILMKILNNMFFSKTSCSFPYHAVGMQFTAKETLGRTKYMRSICRVIYATRLKWKSNSGQILSYILEIVKWHFLKHIKRFFVKIERKYLRQSTSVIRRKKKNEKWNKCKDNLQNTSLKTKIFSNTNLTKNRKWGQMLHTALCTWHAGG